jgi:hypothetical protein
LIQRLSRLYADGEPTLGVSTRSLARSLGCRLRSAATVLRRLLAECFAAGMSTESVLATMFASPALNVVVLAMSFALFPASVALLKLATVLLLILVFAPLMAGRQQPSDAVIACPVEISVSETLGHASLSIARTYAKSFWYVFRIAFSLMLLAAVLGALVVELLPVQSLLA